MKHIHKCSNCKNYTMKEICKCSSPAMIAKPLKYSPEDKLAIYRRAYKADNLKEKGLI